MGKVVNIYRRLLRIFYYFLRLPFVALNAIFTSGWSGLLKKFKNWLQVVVSGQLEYEITSRSTPDTVVHHSTLFAEKVDFISEIIRMAEIDSQSLENDNQNFLDVIVPVYNAYDDFVICLYSLLKHQDIYNILLLNDCSPDSRVQELFTVLKKYEQKKLKVVSNPRNLGYLNTINNGMRATYNDIILLNTDTIVTSGWVRKMMTCALSNDRTATVTPFTNNGRMCSIPRFLQNNEIPDGFTVDSFAKCVEKASKNIYPELVTAVGFCMYIRRSVIDDIGYFDDVNFGKGYGEEVDFSFRAIKKGYKNLLCDNTFIFHKGKASFLDTQQALMEKNHKFLSEKYPQHWAAIAHFERTNPLAGLHRNLKRQIEVERLLARKQ